MGIYGILKELQKSWGKGPVVNRREKGLGYIFAFVFLWGQRIATAYLAIKKNGLESLGVLLASLYEVL